ncbi:unnamed protein product [Ilex paraguariensis]|uniref:Mei2-like C-terminal RNA recognition motif domain-containing protein n=1 Tax=Ilex paraguariensis TaxID=185542 RepID=A0ABC8QSN4_9AQUA
MASAPSPKPLNPNASPWCPPLLRKKSPQSSSAQPPPPQPSRSLVQDQNLFLLPHEFCPPSQPQPPVSPPMTAGVEFSEPAQAFIYTPTAFPIRHSQYNIYINPLLPCHLPLAYPSELGDFGFAGNGGCEERVMGTEKVGKNREGLRSSYDGWERSDERFVASRCVRERIVNRHEYGRKICRGVWKPRKIKSDDGVAVGGTPLPSPSDDLSVYDKTTVMIKNIPNQLRRNTLFKILDKYCQEHKLEYDFVYLPFDFRNDNNLGYAFVNFTTTFAAKRIHELLHNYKWGPVETSKGGVYQSKKICDIRWARIQGRDALVRHFQNSNFVCDKNEYLPVVLSPPRNGPNSTTLPRAIGKCRAFLSRP